MATKWGIVSAGRISHDFVAAVSTLPPTEHQVVAIAARNLQSAKDFAALHKIPNAYSSYADLARDKDVDVVYIGNLNPQHFEVAKMLLEGGKNVLCEKPLCMNLHQAQTLIQISKEKKLFLMEAVWSRCFPVYEQIRREIAAGAIGEVLQVGADFGLHIENPRVLRKDLGGSAVLDLGVYVLQLAIMVCGAGKPQSVKAVGHVNEDGVDASEAIIMTYPGNKTAVLSTSTFSTLRNEALIQGTKGSIKINYPFWCPESVTINGKTSEYPLPPAAHKFNHINSCGLRYEAAEVRRCLAEGLLESPMMPHADSICIAKIQDEVRAQLGVHFSCDP